MATPSSPCDIEQESEGTPSSADKTASEGREAGQEGLAWEISFSSNSSSARKPSLPKFLRDRERSHSGIPSSEAIKPASRSMPGRSSTFPLKAEEGPKSVAGRPSKSAATPSRASKSAGTTRHSPLSLSPKKSPTIKKPLLPVTSPTKKSTRMPDMRSQSDCSLAPSSRAVKGRGDLNKTRPHSARASVGMARKDTPPKGHILRTSSANVSPRDVRSKDEVGSMEMPRPSRSLPVDAVTQGPATRSRLAVTPEEVAQRKVLDLKRWYCMCHPQYSKSCGISSVVSCWNYLFSMLGNGSLPVLTQEDALALLGFQPPFGEINFGPFTGNMTVMKWFQQLCGHFGVSGHSYYFYKPVGRRRTVGIKPGMALEKLQEGLKSPHMAFIYHCHNHYFCPIGYEEVPRRAVDAYSASVRSEETDTWVLIGEPSRRHPAIHCKKWDDVVRDLTCESPRHFNIRRTERGIYTIKTKRTGGNLHCIMAFKKERVLDTISSSLLSMGGVDYTDGAEVNPSEVEDLDSCDSDFPDSKDQDDSSVNLKETTIKVPCDVSPLPQDLSAVEKDESKDEEAVETEPVPGVRRRGTFTKDGPTLQVEVRRSDSESSLDIDGVSTDRGDGDVSGLKRSGTFTKDRPTVLMERTRASSSECESDNDTDHQYNVRKSGTFTKATSDLVKEAITRSSDSDDDSITLTTSVLIRSNTFTKEESSLPFDLLDASDITELGEGQVQGASTEDKDNSTEDLDETLKADDFASDSDA